MSRVVRLERHREVITVAAAVASFLAQHQLSPGSQRVYAGALRALQDHVGADTALALLDEARAAKQFAGWFCRRYGQTAPATRVRQLAILRSACAFWRQRDWLSTDPTASLERPKVPVDRTRALTGEQVGSLWRRDDIALRKRILWRLLYETAARANEICRSTLRTSICPTSALVSAARAERPSGCSGRLRRRCSSRGSWLDGLPARSCWQIANRRGPSQPLTDALSLAVRGCHIAAPRSCSARPPVAGRSINSGTRR
jgi:hypothetical protein